MEEHILEAERIMAMKPARRANSSSPGSEMSVTDALRMTAAWKAREPGSDIWLQREGKVAVHSRSDKHNSQ